MENLLIEATLNSPLIHCNSTDNSITIKGESRPENVKQFYEPLYQWLNNYQSQLQTADNTSVKLNLNLTYFNSSSAKIFLDVVSTLHQLEVKNPKISFIINWFYVENDEDMLEAGKEFENMIGLPMCFVSKNNL